jgi:hypothetical protein
MGVKKPARAKAPKAKATAKRLGDKAADLRSRVKLTKAMGAGLAFAAVVVVAGVVMFAGWDSGERAETTAVAAADDAPAPEPPSTPIRAIAGVPAKAKKPAPPKARTEDAPKSVDVPKTAADLPDAVVIEGCLEQNDAGFRLRNTTGQDAPKSRSWKSGFLKKGARPVDVVDWNNRLKNHVGERISVSGMFVDGEMRVRTLRRVAATCD